MTPDPQSPPEPPLAGRLERFAGIRLVGFEARFTMATRGGIPALWDRFVQDHEPLAGGRETYGVCHDFGEDGSFAYLGGTPDIGQPGREGLAVLEIPAGTYAVFDHAGHISGIGRTWDRAFSDWLPKHGHEVLPGAPQFELYVAGFDPARPGGVAIWLPVAAPQA